MSTNKTYLTNSAGKKNDLPLNFQDLTPGQIRQIAGYIVYTSHNTYRSIVESASSPASFETVIRPLIDLEKQLATRRALCVVPSKCHPDEKIRAASDEAIETLGRLATDLDYHKGYYILFRKYYDNEYQQEKSKLSPEENYYVEKMAQMYERNCMHLSEEELAKVKKLKNEISKKEKEFGMNLHEFADHPAFTEEELSGMPDDWIKNLKIDKDGKHIVPLTPTNYVQILTNANNRGTRERMDLAYNSRCKEANTPLLNETIKLRKELAELLGRKSFAALTLKDKMADNPEYLLMFLNDLRVKLQGPIQVEMKLLQEFARNHEGDETFEIKPCDIWYYMRLYKEKNFKIKENDLLKDFHLPGVLKGMFKIFGGMLGLTFEKIEVTTQWEDSVECYGVYQANGQKIGEFFFDLYFREGKQANAEAMGIINGYKTRDETRLPIGLVLCGFNKDQPLSFYDIKVLFHEFGHLMHYICSGKVPIPSQNGFSVEGDFLEVPSILFELYPLNPDILLQLTTSETVDRELINNFLEGQNTLQGYDMGRKLLNALFDLMIHSENPPEDVNALFGELYYEILQIQYPDDFSFPTILRHIMDYEYAGNMFSYVSGELYSASIRGQFNNDLTNPVEGMKYRTEILEKGSSASAISLMCHYLGLDENKYRPNVDALLQVRHLIESNIESIKSTLF